MLHGCCTHWSSDLTAPNKTPLRRIVRCGHAETARNRRTLGGRGSALAEGAAHKPKGGKTAHRRPGRAHGHFCSCSGMLSQEMGCGSGMTCSGQCSASRNDTRSGGGSGCTREAARPSLGQADRIDWSRASLDSASVPAPGGQKTGPKVRRIAANRAPSATFWSTETVSHSR